jgi:hypothetical protein
MTYTDPLPLHEAPIVGIQPGGGLCMRLEQAWGRFRRGLLRRFFPGHIRRMTALRQGDCPSCPHDVIDSRDLKLVRNVCGYWFRPDSLGLDWPKSSASAHCCCLPLQYSSCWA